jgi:ABC-type amino acid transport substrate-binding protein
MKVRKLVAFLLAGAMSLSLLLSGCGSSGNAGYIILDEALATEHFGVGFRTTDTELRDAVEFTLVEMYKDGTVKTIANKYANDGINYDEGYLLKSTDVKTKPVVDKKTFTVGFDQNFPPYGFVGNDGNFTGFDLDLAAEVAKRNGWEIKYVSIDWTLKDSELASGNIDCIWNGFTIEGRENQYLWTKPYMDNTQVVVVKADSGIKTLKDLGGKVVITQANSAASGLLEDGGDQADLASTFKELRTIPDYNSAFLELDQGSVDAIAVDQPVAAFQIKTHS